MVLGEGYPPKYLWAKTFPIAFLNPEPKWNVLKQTCIRANICIMKKNEPNSLLSASCGMEDSVFNMPNNDIELCKHCARQPPFCKKKSRQNPMQTSECSDPSAVLDALVSEEVQTNHDRRKHMSFLQNIKQVPCPPQFDSKQQLGVPQIISTEICSNTHLLSALLFGKVMFIISITKIWHKPESVRRIWPIFLFITAGDGNQDRGLSDRKIWCHFGVAPNLHFPHLHWAQIYKTPNADEGETDISG